MPESLAEYTSFVDASIEQISNNLKSKISSLVLSNKDLLDQELNYSNYFKGIFVSIWIEIIWNLNMKRKQNR